MAEYDPSMHGSHLEEIQLLKKRVVCLETAEADNDKLRKKLARLQISTQEDRAHLELDFMNQLTEMGTENAKKLEKLEGRLSETSKENQRLREQLRSPPKTPDQLNTRIQTIEAIHRKELAQAIDNNMVVIDALRKELSIVKVSRDEVRERLDDTMIKLELKQSEIHSLELKVKELSSSTPPNLPVGSDQLPSAMQDANNVTLTMASLQKENLRLLNAVKEGEKQRENLKGKIEQLQKSKQESETTSQQLEEKVRDLQVSLHSMEQENKEPNRARKERKASFSNLESEIHSHTGASTSERRELSTLQSDNEATRPLLSENRTTQMIRKLEQNLKREGLIKQNMTASLKSRKQQTEIDTTRGSLSDSSDALRKEIKSLRIQLDKEKELTSSLRREIKDSKPNNQKASTELPAHSQKSNRQNDRDHVSLATRKASLKFSHAIMNRESPRSSGKTCESPSTEVSGIVQNFERRISKLNENSFDKPPADDDSLFDMNDVEQLKDALLFERDQVFELEEELTRQCEINCSLIKEIGCLTSETEELRSKQVRHFESSCIVDQEEIDELMTEISELKAQLSQAEESKSLLSKKFEKISLDDRNKIIRLERECESLSKATSKNSGQEKIEMDIMKTKINNLVAELDRVTENRDELERKYLENQDNFVILQSQVNQKVGEFELSHKTDKEVIGRLQDQVRSLHNELQDTLRDLESLRGKLKEKEEAEASVEQLERQNRQSLDRQINHLQKELTETKVAEEDYRNKIERFEDTIKLKQKEMDENMEKKEREIEDLKKSVDDKKSDIQRLSKEKEQLVLSMNDMVASRRDEIDELQAELIETSTRAANQNREVQAAKLQLEECDYHKEEAERLRSRMQELEDQLAESDNMLKWKKTLLEAENSKLRQKIRELSTERQNIEYKLNKFVEDRGETSKSNQVLRERNAALKLEVEKLNKKLMKLKVRKASMSTSNAAERVVI